MTGTGNQPVPELDMSVIDPALLEDHPIPSSDTDYAQASYSALGIGNSIGYPVADTNDLLHTEVDESRCSTCRDMMQDCIKAPNNLYQCAYCAANGYFCDITGAPGPEALDPAIQLDDLPPPSDMTCDQCASAMLPGCDVDWDMTYGCSNCRRRGAACQGQGKGMYPRPDGQIVPLCCDACFTRNTPLACSWRRVGGDYHAPCSECHMRDGNCTHIGIPAEQLAGRRHAHYMLTGQMNQNGMLSWNPQVRPSWPNDPAGTVQRPPTPQTRPFHNEEEPQPGPVQNIDPRRRYGLRASNIPGATLSFFNSRKAGCLLCANRGTTSLMSSGCDANRGDAQGRGAHACRRCTSWGLICGVRTSAAENTTAFEVLPPHPDLSVVPNIIMDICGPCSQAKRDCDRQWPCEQCTVNGDVCTRGRKGVFRRGVVGTDLIYYWETLMASPPGQVLHTVNHWSLKMPADHHLQFLQHILNTRPELLFDLGMRGEHRLFDTWDQPQQPEQQETGPKPQTVALDPAQPRRPRGRPRKYPVLSTPDSSTQPPPPLAPAPAQAPAPTPTPVAIPMHPAPVPAPVPAPAPAPVRRRAPRKPKTMILDPAQPSRGPGRPQKNVFLDPPKTPTPRPILPQPTTTPAPIPQPGPKAPRRRGRPPKHPSSRSPEPPAKRPRLAPATEDPLLGSPQPRAQIPFIPHRVTPVPPPTLPPTALPHRVTPVSPPTLPPTAPPAIPTPIATSTSATEDVDMQDSSAGDSIPQEFIPQEESRERRNSPPFIPPDAADGIIPPGVTDGNSPSVATDGNSPMQQARSLLPPPTEVSLNYVAARAALDDMRLQDGFSGDDLSSFYHGYYELLDTANQVAQACSDFPEQDAFSHLKRDITNRVPLDVSDAARCTRGYCAALVANSEAQVSRTPINTPIQVPPGVVPAALEWLNPLGRPIENTLAQIPDWCPTSPPPGWAMYEDQEGPTVARNHVHDNSADYDLDHPERIHMELIEQSPVHPNPAGRSTLIDIPSQKTAPPPDGTLENGQLCLEILDGGVRCMRHTNLFCESRTHSVDVPVCEPCDAASKQRIYNLSVTELTRSMRAYLCHACLPNATNPDTWDATGFQVFGIPEQGPGGYDARCAAPDNSGRLTGGFMGGLHPVTGCTCGPKLYDRILCNPHRLQRVLDIHKDIDAMRRYITSLHGKMVCLLCRINAGIDSYMFSGEKGGQNQRVAWACLSCHGFVVMAAPTAGFPGPVPSN